MATLRDGIFGNPDAPVSQGFKDRLSTSGMGSLQRGWESGRIGNELNPLYTEELEAGIANDQPRRSLLRNQIDTLKQRQAAYAPEVSDLRQINGIGDAGSWAAGQVGQGAASMVDPMAVSAGLGVVGRVANAIPHPLARVVGGAAQVGQFAVPALMSKRQLTGEFIGEAEQDPELMARTSKQGLRDMAGNYGTIAAIPDSALPGIVGRQVSGLSRAGGAVARKAALGPGLSTLGEMGVEGLTEGAQAAGSQYARGVLNPDRDTSGDNWDIINNAAGGAVGAGPFAGAGSYAEAGHNRVGAGAEAVKGAVGSVVDMANTNPTVQAGVAKAKSIAERVRGSTVDMMSNDEGKVSAAALIDNLKAGAQDLKSKGQAVLDEHSILNQIPPEGVELDAKWLAENDPKRAQLVADKLNGMPDDQDAQQYLDAIMGAQGDEAQHAAVNDGAQFLVAKAPLGRAEERMNSLGENLGKIAGVVAPALGRGAVAVGKAALGFGKAVLGGAKDGMSKKNEQTNEAPAEESFGAWRDRNYGVKGVEAADSALAEGASYKKAVDFYQRAELAGSYAEDMAKRGTLKNKNAGVFAKHVAFSIADMIDTDLSKGGVEAKAIKLNRLTTDFHDIYGKNAAEVITQMGSILGKGASPVVEHMLTQLEQQQSAQGRAALVTERDMLAKQVVGLVDPAMQNTLMKQGVNLNTPSGRDHVLRIMEDFADKISSDPQARKALDGVLGAESVQNILTLLNGQPEKESPYGTSNQFDSQETRDGEKLAAKGSGPKVYGFHKAPNLRTNSERRDMFGAMDKPDSDGIAQRPQLFEKGAKLFGGRDAIEKKIEDVKAQLAGDPEYPDHDNHSVTAKSAYEVMKEAGMQPGKVLQLYRDYALMDGDTETSAKIGSLLKAMVQARTGSSTSSIEEKQARKERAKAWSNANPGKSVEDYKTEMATKRIAALAGPVAEAVEAAESYFKEKYLIVGEQLSNRDPSQISLPEMLDMHKEGAGLIERSRLTEEPKQTLADANVLMFKSGAVKGGEVAIPAGKLVNWVRKMRGSTEQSSAEDNDQSYSNKSKDDEYRNDVMEGIASLIGSGHVKGMPYKLNKFGAVESFAKGIPDSLRLATKTHGESVFADAKRREKYLTDLPEADPTKREALRARLESAKGAYADIVKGGASKEEVEAARHAVGAAKTALDEYADANSGEYESAVTKEQTRERSDETEGSIDDTVDDAPMSKREIRNALTRAEKVELNSKATHEERVAYIKSITKGMGIADAAEFLRDLELTNANGAAFNPDAKTSKTGDRSKTPLDFFPKAEGVPDEFANQRWLSKQTGATTDASIGPEPKGTAASSAKFRAQKIGEAFLRDSAEGMDMIKMRIRSAMRPVYSADKTAVVGGVHYIAPVAAFINAEELAKANVDLPAKTIQAIQSKVANILLKGDVSMTEKVKIARLMLDGQEKVTDMNVDAVLGRYAEVATKAEDKAYFLQGVRETREHFNNYAQMTPDEEKHRYFAGQVDEIRRGIVEFGLKGKDLADAQDLVDHMSKRVGHLSKSSSAPEVANAGLPKGALTLSGGVKLPVTGGYTAKDQVKSDKATKFIGRGSSASSTAKYATAWGDRANTGSYSSNDRVFISAEGNRLGRLSPDADEIQKALDAGATIITDDATNRERSHNVGERQVVRQLMKGGYVEASPGTWLPRANKAVTLSGGSEGRKLNAMAVDIHRSLGRDGFAATHDSPIRHEGKFDWRSHIGKGEGNAAFGAGTYLSTGEGVHKSYKNQFTTQSGNREARVIIGNKKVTLFFEDETQSWEQGYGDEILTGVEQSIAERMILGSTFAEAAAASRAEGEKWFTASETALNALWLRPYRDLIAQREELPASLEKVAEADDDLVDTDTPRAVRMWNRFVRQNKEAMRAIDSLRGMRVEVNKSPTYEVSVNIKPEELLDWDKPLSEQSEAVQEALYTLWGDKEIDTGNLDDFHRGGATGAQIYRMLERELGSQRDASDALQEYGILGHKYAASGGKNDTHPNYVVYDDSRITTNYVHFNNQDAREGNSKVSTQAERDAAVAEAKKLFGDQVKVDFQDITGYSGEFIDATNVIVISTTAAAGTMNTLFHEAMHKFFKDFVKSNPKLQAVFESLINDPKHLQKLHDLLDGYPAAQAQLTSGEERLAYTYQFWKAGLLQVDTKAHTWLQKVGKFFRHVLGRVRDSERALELFQAFDNGKMSEPSAAGMVIAKALNRGSNALKVRRQVDGLIQGLAALTVPAAEILGNSLSPTARALSPMMFTNPGEESHGSKEIGMLNARRNVAQQYTNVSNRRFETMSEVDKAAVQKYLQSGADPATIPSKEQREAVKDIRHLLDRFHKYMTDSGMDIGKIDNYYPVVWNPYLLNSNRTEFINMLVTKYADKMGTGNPQKAAERIWQSLVNKEGVDAHLPVGREDGVLSPFFASQEQRTLPWLEAADREKYLDKNMPLTLTRYFSQGAHATEYFRRFGKNGVKLEKMLSQINSELSGVAKEMMKRGEIADEKARVKWVSRQMRDVSQSVGAMEGTLGKDVSPSMRTFNSWMTVYQNIRLLPMALFSSFVDPLALVARGAPFQAAYETFTYSMREVFRNWADAFKDMPPERAKDEWRQLAEHIGASEIAMFQHHVSDEYSSTYMTPGAKKINDKMFTFNGMEAWNRGSRIMATKWAVRFIEQHAGLPDKNHSARWLKELGLTPSMITMDDGKLVTSPQQLAVLKGITLDEARAQIAPIHDALNRWVEGAVLTPNAAQRPAWSSDPNYATAFHLKQFSYSFHQTILKRATNEFSHGNMAPLTALAMFIPTMIGADLMKGLIQGGGSLPPYMASMNAGDWVMHGAQRAGLSGIGVIGMDAATDWASLGGPAFEQIIDAARDGFGSKTVLNAAPLHSLYGQLATA